MNSSLAATASRFLTFEAAGQLYALPANEIAEIIRVTTLARVPQAPAALLGVTNLRGTVLPVVSLRVLLGMASPPASTTTSTSTSTSTSAIVMDVGAPVALVVDAVAALESVERARIEQPEENLAGTAAQKFLGAFPVAAERVARILDVQALLEAAFARRARTNEDRAPQSVIRSRREAVVQAAEMLVTFEVSGQEFALPLATVQEILPAPAQITKVARAEAAVLGITSVRDRLLPLLSLRALLGFPAADEAQSQKVIVLRMGASQVGLVADRARAVLAAAPDLVDAVPPVLAARTGGESRIRSVYRAEGGRRLISILSPEQLFRSEVMQRLAEGQATSDADPTQPRTAGGKELVFLVFRLAGDEFALPIETVVEVAQVPEQVTRVPRTPKFLEGVVNLRGEVLPIVDQRRRFDMPPLDANVVRRLVVIRTARHRAGIIVDAVTGVLRATESQVEPPPQITDAVSRLVSGVLNLEQSSRIVLLLDPTELLTRAEQGLLDTFQARGKKANA